MNTEKAALDTYAIQLVLTNCQNLFHAVRPQAHDYLQKQIDDRLADIDQAISALKASRK
jgi:hypothetical protein